MGEDNYDALRKKNIAERNAIFAEIFQDVKKDTSELINPEKKERDEIEDSENQPPKKRRRTFSNGTKAPRGSRVQLEFRRKYNTRSRNKNLNSNRLHDSERDDDDNSLSRTEGSRRKLQVMFPWSKPIQREIDLMRMDDFDVDQEEEYSDDDFEQYKRKNRAIRVAKSAYDPDSVPSVDEITQEMLDNIAERSSFKNYNKAYGTSCHQCRQKTLDTKTVCRSGECIGVRGQFCGPCLKGRYGESALEALKDPSWACPPCRGLCNCSICRTRNGLPPTGILAPVAQEEGFSSVMDYLLSAENDEEDV